MNSRYNDPQYVEYLKAKAMESKRKTPLVFAILGLLFGVVMGMGIVFSLIAISGYLRYRKLGGTSLKWALVLGIVGAVLNIGFIVSINLLYILAYTPLPLT